MQSIHDELPDAINECSFFGDSKNLIIFGEYVEWQNRFQKNNNKAIGLPLQSVQIIIIRMKANNY